MLKVKVAQSKENVETLVETSRRDEAMARPSGMFSSRVRG